MSWTNPRLGRVPSPPASCTCAKVLMPHAASYRWERTDDKTGTIETHYLCAAAAARIASDYRLEFPPGGWSDAR